ncbi:SDR family oxidoreductase [Kribbella sandramycini]|uniref:3-oxoacyl-[acyl-carrier protein] reductase n=1 Tax=Kribbella sandramycini TaxID=60450 RepID=A0A7Y4P0G8_9ACTN|nr:SDR family oxidoreductase [Kribbella sandramycini]MBB6566191.1 3-oxoacyl-[acyl-carrier protein] reductase [Kribbella sandramycini]NOL43142.1 SDR family oxidoreductase [Kribbella sandramycini]
MGVLDGKAALVTGGSRGIGAAIVRRLAADGAAVTFTYNTSAAAADEVVAEVKAAGGTAIAVQADQADVAAIPELFDRAAEPIGALDIFVCNAAQAAVTPIAAVTEASYDELFATNLRGPFFAVQRAAEVLRDGGRVIAISTLNTQMPVPGVALYAGSKAALEQFMKIAAREYGARAITFNSVSPGATSTDMFHDHNPPEIQGMLVAATALGRIGEPSDVADIVAFLAGPDSRWITGQNLAAAGGLLI